MFLDLSEVLYKPMSFCLFLSGALISHEKLLLQINTEREIGNMGYKLGQVCTVAYSE